MCDKRPMELADTAEMMMSKDYKERFRAEYCQVVIRYQKLKAMLEKWDLSEKYLQYADQSHDRLYCSS